MLSFIVVVILMFITPGPGVLSLAGTGVSTPDQNCTERRRESAPFGWIWPE